VSFYVSAGIFLIGGIVARFTIRPGRINMGHGGSVPAGH